MDFGSGFPRRDATDLNFYAADHQTQDRLLAVTGMASITLSNVSVSFPVFSSQSRGLINTLLGYSRRPRGRIALTSKRPLRIEALRNVSLDLQPGDRVGLVGRNGAGKTTLLRVLSGAYEPTEGALQVDGRTSALTDLMLGMDPEANGYDFIRARGIMLGLSVSARKSIIPDIEEFTGLGDYLHLPVRTYSSGMLLRLAFAVATAVRPDVLLMDEMIGVGDTKFLEKANRRLKELMQSVEILVLASHDENILRSFCNKAVLLDNGQIIASGVVDDIFERYENTI